jgi:phosphomannomutase/phosphoglucomutase
MNHHIFREYDIRGLVETDLTEETVVILARGIGTYFRHD